MKLDNLQKLHIKNNDSLKPTFTSKKLLNGVITTNLAQLQDDIVEFNKKPFNYIDLNILKLLCIRNLRTIGQKTVSGGTFERRPLTELITLKNSGIEAIIDFRTEGSGELAKKCGDLGLKYLRLPLDQVRERENIKYFIKEKGKPTQVTAEFIAELKKYFEMMNKSNCYVGCHYGIDRTNIGLLLNYFFNPKYNEVPPKIIFWPGEYRKNILNRNIKSIKKIFKALTPEQKKELNIPDNFEECLREKISRLLRHNYKTTP